MGHTLEQFDSLNILERTQRVQTAAKAPNYTVSDWVSVHPSNICSDSFPPSYTRSSSSFHIPLFVQIPVVQSLA